MKSELILLLSIVFLFPFIFALGNLDLSGNRVWVSVEPVQCGLNPWENQNSVEPEEDLIVSFMENKDINVYEIKIEQEYELTCSACSCPRGDVIYLLIDKDNLARLQSMGFSKNNSEK